MATKTASPLPPTAAPPPTTALPPTTAPPPTTALPPTTAPPSDRRTISRRGRRPQGRATTTSDPVSLRGIGSGDHRPDSASTGPGPPAGRRNRRGPALRRTPRPKIQGADHHGALGGPLRPPRPPTLREATAGPGGSP
ncbi:proline-rich receptor-like protein kinase PERK2 [Camponotus floridanus]|uniref:proline-rich receptor-like protein kinase PERK2 n=1 Tax=Camponotus floridanus TaxID=104421 RepID=UPI000DC6C27F|nr:proline-rich receptor-like protein kinase PERK2 [Camponotus floridanus]